MITISYSPIKSPIKEKPKIHHQAFTSPLRQRIVPVNIPQHLLTPNYRPGKVLETNQTPIKKDQRHKILLRSDIERQAIQDENCYFSKNYPNLQISSRSNSINKQYQGFKYNCQKCSQRKQSYFIVQQNMKYCSNCALQEMKKGKQVCSLNDFENSRSLSSTYKTSRHIEVKNSRQSQLLDLMTKVDNQSKKINQLLSQHLQTQTQIKQKFTSKRQILKTHYERLKQIIQISIKKDLEAIRLEQQAQLSGHIAQKTKFQNDLLSLKAIRIDLEPNIGKFIQPEDNLFKTFMIPHQAQAQRIQTHISISLEKSHRIKEGLVLNSQYSYEPETFMLTSKSHLKKDLKESKPNTLFSFENC